MFEKSQREADVQSRVSWTGRLHFGGRRGECGDAFAFDAELVEIVGQHRAIVVALAAASALADCQFGSDIFGLPLPRLCPCQYL